MGYRKEENKKINFRRKKHTRQKRNMEKDGKRWTGERAFINLHQRRTDG